MALPLRFVLARICTSIAALCVAVGFVVTVRLDARAVDGANDPTCAAHDVHAFEHTVGWEIVSGRSDGRFHGESLRSSHAGSRAELTFDGTAFRLYGVVGRGGGLALVSIDGKPYFLADFYATRKETHRLIYASPILPEGSHRLSIEVMRKERMSSGSRYVNLECADVS